jgi:hypothetical protein
MEDFHLFKTFINAWPSMVFNCARTSSHYNEAFSKSSSLDVHDLVPPSTILENFVL